ncbi:MAG: hypothetical protein CBB67_009545 [Alteromonadaceae bacterium TMED7]|nr:MAG: hypothetical protein CBB67_009545 [Alteromonadaceae bacterium TMED7]
MNKDRNKTGRTLCAWLLGSAGFMAFAVGAVEKPLTSLKNYQVNTPQMMSSGLPDAAHFETFKSLGVTRVIDLIPGDRNEEQTLVSDLGMDYHNIQVEWENPTVANFVDYVAFMESPAQQGVTLTHCKLNWRGAVFTYLYRVIRLQENEAAARQDMLAIWQPNDTWQHFIEKVKQHYQSESFAG